MEINYNMDRPGRIICMTVNDFFTDFLKREYKEMTERSRFQILIVSKDIIAGEKYVSNHSCYSKYLSRYKNINFVPELFPSPSVMEYVYNSSLDHFGQMYKSQLNGLEQMKTICSIIDLVVNDGYDIIMLCSKVEMKMEFLCYFNEFIMDNFDLIVDNYSTRLADKKVENDTEVDYGDYEKAKTLLKFQLGQLKLTDKTLGTFINQFTTDMAKEYRDILMKKSIDELYIIGNNRGIHVNRHRPKDYIVDHILSSILGDKDPSKEHTAWS